MACSYAGVCEGQLLLSPLAMAEPGGLLPASIRLLALAALQKQAVDLRRGRP